MLKNLALFVTALFLMLVLGEWLFPKILGKLPLRLYGSIDKNLRILAQSSKKSTLPHEYIAIVGDSYAVGAGDWLEEVRGGTGFFGSPSYSPAHLINEKTGIDVVSFGQGGAGSFGGIWKEPITQFLHINSVKNYHLSPPKYFLVFFYEGNDIYENVGFLRKKLFSIKKGSLKKKTELNEVIIHLNREFQKVLDGDYSRNLWKNMLFTRSLSQGISNLVKEFTFSNKNLPFYFSFPKTPISLGLINDEKTPLPMHLQAPPLFGIKEPGRKFSQAGKLTNQIEKFHITEGEYKLGLVIFERALVVLAGFFPQTEIKVVFIPSPLSSYGLVSQKVSYRGYMESKNLEEVAVINRRHAELCEAIRDISVVRKVSFLNTTKSLRRVAYQEFIHGPTDWDHFNKKGYEALSTDIAEIFLKPGGGVRTDNCIY
jgi:hypothetical protein